MKKTKFSHKIIAVFLVFTFMPSLFPVNYLFASSAGPTAPEASSFEPVDATDMVNLGTGDLSYVLPLLNVPSPEGGYPISMSYHAGIGLDQEASWVGLGWNINPGSINRSVNGYPDDWNKGKYKEYFYDIGGKTVYESASIGYTGFSTGFNTAALNMNWVDGKATGGSVSFGYGISEVANIGFEVGTNGASIDGNFGLKGTDFSIGGSIGTNGAGVGIGYKNSEAGNSYGGKIGLNSSWSGDIGANLSFSQTEKGRKSSLGINFSSQGTSISSTIQGTGANFSFGKAIQQSDYNTDRSGYFIPIFIPLGEGGINLSYAKQVIKYDLDKIENNEVSGPLYFAEAQDENGYWECRFCNYDRTECDIHIVEKNHTHNGTNLFNVRYVKPSTDVYEVDVRNNSQSLELDNNNAVFPNYDKYRVTAQGLSGSMKPKLYENGALLGLSKKIEDEDSDGYNLNYQLPISGSNQVTHFDSGVNFHFDNEYTSSLLINPVSFDDTNSADNIYDYLETSVAETVERKKEGRFVESFTNNQLSNNSGFSSGLLKANATIDYGDTDQYEPEGIGAFKITSADGKTYHYAQPVYNHEVISRQYGMSPENPHKDDAFFEKRQLKKYATHWLLTAVTGPDYIDTNQNSLADEGDYGYWVMMDYGRWSEGYIWYAPHGEEYRVAEENANLKYYTWGRKEIYYLDKVKTRTHTALFIKEQRNDNVGKSLGHKLRKNKNTSTTLSFPSQSLLRLKEIMLLKNEDANAVSKTNSNNIQSIPAPNYTNTVTWYDPTEDGGGIKSMNYSQQNNVLDSKDDSDNWTTIRDKSLKTIDFSGYSYELANGAPFTFGGVTGRLALKNVTFKGKGGVQVMPSYNFKYHQGAYILNHKDEWGYDKYHPEKWSLNEIKMPTGGKIQIEYEPDTFHSAINHKNTFEGTVPDSNGFLFMDSPTTEFSEFDIKVNDKISISHREFLDCSEINEDLQKPFYRFKVYHGKATVVQLIGPNRIKLKLDGAVREVTRFPTTVNCSELIVNDSYTRATIPNNAISSGTRVKSIKTTDGVQEFRTEYNYNLPNTDDTSGVVSYIPFSNNVDSEVPYGIELPAPVPMYGNVRTTAYGNNNKSLGYNDYEFKVLPPHNGHLIFGDVLEMNTSLLGNTFNTANNKQVRIEGAEIIDNTATLGQLLSTSQYNNKGQLLSKTINNYATRSEIEQGITREVFQTYKEVDYINPNTPDKWMIGSSSRIVYPSSLKSTTVFQGGFQSTTYFDKYDETSGQLLETRTERSDGVEFKTITTPAFKKYGNMGSKVDQLSNKNMLVQNAVNKTLLWVNGKWKISGTNITTWGTDTYFANTTAASDVWRKRKSYTWDGQSDSEGLFTGFTGEDDGFDWINDNNSNSDWKQISEISKYDQYSMPLESIDINGNEASTKMGDHDTKILAVGNAAFSELHYSGAEYLSVGMFNNNIEGFGQTTEKAHTGKYSVKIASGEEGFKTNLLGKHAPGKYKISFWVNEGGQNNAVVYIDDNLLALDASTDIERRTNHARDWVLYSNIVSLDGSEDAIHVGSFGSTIYIDDFRLHPLGASMNSYVYNDWGEMTDVLDANNFATKYEYDAIGRLVRTYSEIENLPNIDPERGGFKKVVENAYQSSANITTTIEPLFATVKYGSSTPLSQEFRSTVTGGSGNYNFKWYNGVGDSSTVFESGVASTSANYTRTNISGCNERYVKLVVTDNVHSSLGESVRVIRNDNECDPDNSENQE